MKTTFDPAQGHIRIHAFVTGSKRIEAILAFDTGAAVTVLNHEIIRLAGIDENKEVVVKLTTGSDEIQAHPISIKRFDALGVSVNHFQAVAHTLPESSNLDGVLGLDFIRGRKLLLDMQQGEIEILKTAA